MKGGEEVEMGGGGRERGWGQGKGVAVEMGRGKVVGREGRGWR